MEIIQKTGVPTKNKGDGLSSTDVNRINGAVNQSIDANNLFLKIIFDANLEQGTTRSYTLQEAIILVPESRRRTGLKVRFLTSTGIYDELIYIGDDISSENWNNPDNWSRGSTIIDGGEF